MAPAFDAVGPSSGGAGNLASTSLSWSHTVTGAQTWLLVGVGLSTAGADTGMSTAATCNGVAMTSLGIEHADNDTHGYLQVWGLAVAAGAASIVVTVTGGTPTSLAGGSLSFSAASGFGTPVIVLGDSAAPSVAVASNTAGNIIAAFAAVGSPVSTATAPGTSRFILNEDPNGGAGNVAGSTSPATGSSVTMAWSSGFDEWAVIAVEVKAAAAPPPPPRPPQIPFLLLEQLLAAGHPYTADQPAVIGPVPGAVRCAASIPGPAVSAGAVASPPAVACAAVIPHPVTGPGLFLTGTAGSGTALYFTNQAGNPYMVRWDTVWALIANAGNSGGATTYQTDMDGYVAARSAQGFNGMLVTPTVTSDNGGASNGDTWDGVAPFTSPGVLNNTFWTRVDYLLASAQAAGMTVAINAMFTYALFNSGGCLHGWTTTQYQDYGAAVGARYASQPNLIWEVGDDYGGSWVGGLNFYDTQFAAFLTGLRGAGANQLISVENMSEGSSRYSSSPGTTYAWGVAHAQFNWCYSYGTSYSAVEDAYTEAAANSVAPLVNVKMDGWYDNQWGPGHTPTESVELFGRKWLWWVLSSGSRGAMYGNGDLFGWPSGALSSGLVSSSPGSSYVQPAALKAAWDTFASLPGWHELVPDTSSALVTAGRSTRSSEFGAGAGSFSSAAMYLGGNTYVTASITAAGDLAVIYIPSNATITVNGSLMTPGYAATWVDPASGARTPATIAATYNHPGANSAGDADWVLVLAAEQDAASAPSAVAGSATIPAPAVSAGTVASPAAVACAATIPAPAVAAGSVSQPVAVAAAAAIPGPVLSTGADVSPTAVAAAATVPTPSVSAGSAASAAPSAVACSAAIPAPAISSSQTAAPSAVLAAAIIPAPVITSAAAPAPAAVSAAATIPAPALTTGQTAAPSAVACAATVATPPHATPDIALWGTSPPSLPSGSIDFGSATSLAGLFKVTESGWYLKGYLCYCLDADQTAADVPFATWTITGNGTGTVLAGSEQTGNFTVSESDPNIVYLDTPLALTANQVYAAAIGDSQNGLISENYFTGGGDGAAGLSVPPLFAFSDQSGSAPDPSGNPQGLFQQTSNDPAADFPALNFSSSNFWISPVISQDPSGLSVSLTSTDPTTGVSTYTVTAQENNTGSAGPQQMRVLPPVSPAPGYDHAFLIMLPVDPGQETTFGDAMGTAVTLGANDTYNLTVVQPGLPMHPWYGDNPDDASTLQESFILDLVTWLKANLATTGHEAVYLIGFSSSGLGGQGLQFRHPDIFAATASWDAPFLMTSYDGDDVDSGPVGGSSALVYGTDANFTANYELSATNLTALKGPFTTTPRLWIGGFAAFEDDTTDYKSRLTSEGITFTAGSMTGTSHAWHTPWVAEALASIIFPIVDITPDPVAATATVPATSLSTGQTASPSAVQAAASIPGPAVSTGSVTSPAAVQAPAAIPGPVAGAGQTATPSAVQAAASIPAPAIAQGAGADPAAVLAAAAVPGPALSTGQTASPAAVQTATTIPAPSVSAGGSASTSPAAVAASAAIPGPVITAGATIAGLAIQVTASIPAAVPAAGSATAPGAVTCTVTIPAPDVQTGTNATAQPVAVSCSVMIPAPALTLGTTVQATVLACAAAIASAVIAITLPPTGLSAGYPHGRWGTGGAPHGRWSINGQPHA